MAGKNKEILSRLTHGVLTLKKLAPKVTEQFLSFDIATTEAGVLDHKTKELIAMAIGVAARCDGCIAVHVNNCLTAGATVEEIAEALGVAIGMGGGPSLVYATRALEALAEFTDKTS
ncbi:MAG TPA: carboxymuconolactone decarboxylase family protein [Gemmatales bacterium]|nr:carboxymuconolactone decarboxylase family protein [Gemmatales bacterium]